MTSYVVGADSAEQRRHERKVRHRRLSELVRRSRFIRRLRLTERLHGLFFGKRDDAHFRRVDQLMEAAGLDPKETFALCVENGRVCHAEVINHDACADDRHVHWVHNHRQRKWIELAQ